MEKSPYEPLDAEAWEKGTRAQPGAKTTGKVMWKGATAQYKVEGASDWIEMNGESGQASASSSVPVFVTGGEIRT